MSSLFKTLTDEDLKLSKPSPAPQKPRMTGYKIAIFFSFLLSLAALAGAGLLKNSLDAERSQREALEATQTQLRQKADTYEKSAEQYRVQLQQIQDQIKTYTAEKQELQKQVEAGRAQVEDLKKNLAAIQKAKENLEKQTAEATAGTDTPGIPATPLSAAAAAVKPAVKAVTAPQAPKPPQVLTVNRKFNFAVVNIGLQQKLKIGDILEVMRKDKPVGRLQVEKLYESFSAASIVKEPKDAPIQEGDSVRPAV
jgi:predicted RNase H-like nuclease (RuvC/YqgF family)